MKLTGIKVSINFTTIKGLINRIRKKKEFVGKIEVEDRIIVKGIKYRVYDADDETFKAIKDDEIKGLAEQHKSV